MNDASRVKLFLNARTGHVRTAVISQLCVMRYVNSWTNGPRLMPDSNPNTSRGSLARGIKFLVSCAGRAHSGGAPHRRALISHLAGLGTLVLFHYLPLHLSPMRLRFGGRQGDCSVTEDLADRLLRFPFFTGMSSSDQAQVIDAVRAFRC
jgi:hypothetical protein